MRRWFVVVLASVVVLSGVVQAAPGSWTDPNDSSDGLDMLSGGHSDTSERITYTLRMQDGFTVGDVYLITWSMHERDEASVTTAAGYVDVWDSNNDGRLDGRVVRNDGFNTKIADATVTHTNGSADIEVSYALSALRQLGISAGHYFYTVDTKDNPIYFSDRAPNSGTIRHDLGGSGPTPTPTPVPTPTPTPTPAPTPTPLPTPPPPTPTPPPPTPTPGTTPQPTPPPDDCLVRVQVGSSEVCVGWPLVSGEPGVA
jgi:hypothetical protein